jgi:toxin ParE1/3/4
MKLRFTPRAIFDLTQIADYIRAENPNAALRVRSAIFDSLQTLILFPRIGKPQTVQGVRKLVTRVYPYLVYYEIDASQDEIVILSIQHPARERPYADT